MIYIYIYIYIFIYIYISMGPTLAELRLKRTNKYIWDPTNEALFFGVKQKINKRQKHIQPSFHIENNRGH